MAKAIHPILRLLFLSAAFCYGAEESRYQLIGTIKLSEGGEFSRRALPVVLLDGIHIPFSAHTRADLSGNFKFTNLHADRFTLIVYVPRSGECRQTIEVSPSLADSKLRIFVEVTFQRGNAGKAPQEVSAKQLLIPERALKEYGEGNKRLRKRDAEGAIEHFKKAVALAPPFADAWNTLGTLAYKSNQLELAESYFREALKQDPTHYPSMVNLGGVLLPQGKMREALPLNLAAVTRMPDDALVHAQLGLNYYFLRNFDEAEKYLKQAITLDPGHFSFPQLPLADIYIDKKDYPSALRMLEQFLSLHPDAKQAAAVQKQTEALRSLR